MYISYDIALSFAHFFFFFNDTATTEIYTLSLHDALPILITAGRTATRRISFFDPTRFRSQVAAEVDFDGRKQRSEEHTSELQSRQYLVCRLLLEKKNKNLSMKTFYHNIYTSDPDS